MGEGKGVAGGRHVELRMRHGARAHATRVRQLPRAGGASPSFSQRGGRDGVRIIIFIRHMR